MTLDCPYLLQSRNHDRPEPANLRKFPNQDIRLTETFLRDHEPLLIALGKGYWPRRLQTPGAVEGARARTGISRRGGFFSPDRRQTHAGTQLRRGR